ncbi:nucleotidyl transferase AbiEii/AbiGii toxin family protein [Flavobacterium sp. TAB 87]|uniref:nucleotidyl transferase AbiEii/AbiGii toxin family protein n=1 Tax=Flavobacterium sp. TAB 87 TaxID=1729581 RepID=UPI00076DDCE2|nr:nucleotidyl transferase AbiEii/AbiGii toxin family protein [Flavobacterium sp. TAB 87]KVV16217.1 hypothetical protein AP058_00275 [Flavobacterium sp. TAB 87]
MRIYKNTVSDLLWETLKELMTFEVLDSFRLVGGTSLSLLLGHRMSIDIDLFTDAEYGTIDFEEIDAIFLASFPCVEMGGGGNNSMGKTYFIGENQENLVKVDLFYTDPFVYPIIKFEGVRLSQLEEITAMKLEVVGHGGRKKDFWDLHELLNYYSISEMIDFYELRYPYSHSRTTLIKKLSDFNGADSDFDPICLHGKYWELIKLDFEEKIANEFN